MGRPLLIGFIHTSRLSEALDVVQTGSAHPNKRSRLESKQVVLSSAHQPSPVPLTHLDLLTPPVPPSEVAELRVKVADVYSDLASQSRNRNEQEPGDSPGPQKGNRTTGPNKWLRL